MSDIQLKRGLTLTWFNTNPVLKQGEPGLETDSNKVKIGNGVLHWRDLPYFGYYSFGDLVGVGPVQITGGTGCVLGTGASITIDFASGTQPGILSAEDYTTLMAKYSDLPSQTGKTGKFLMSGGSKGSETWETAPVDATSSVNKAMMAAMAIALS